MACDLVISGGTVVDGTGAAPFTADVGISGDRIVEVGRIDPAGARRVIDADGLLLTPGFVDLHSHLDAQVAWDPLMTSSCWHGVTTVLMGNCGMTFAPVRPDDGPRLAHMMESVEDIPARSIIEGLDWSWRTYGEYLDVVDALPKGINCAGYVGDVAVRTYVCGDAACDDDFRASPGQLAEMAALVEEALCAGAVGYSISRSLSHRVPDGRFVPGTWSDPAEFAVIAEPLGRLRKGLLECAPRYNEVDGSTSRVDAEMAWIADLSRRTGRPFTFNLMQMRSLGDHYRRVLELTRAANASGARLRPQTTPRSIGVLFSLGANTLLDGLPSFAAVRQGDQRARLAALTDPALRATLIAEGAGQGPDAFRRMFVMHPDHGARYRYEDHDSLGAWSERRGVSPIECYLDLLAETAGRVVINWPVLNEDFDAIAELLAAPETVMGLADAGAHATQIMDASQPTFLLAHWVREQGALTLQDAVRRVTSDTARLAGFQDRGEIRVGAFADVNLIDLDAVSLELPEIVMDFPGGAPRFIQRANGIEATVVNGAPFLIRGEHTGELRGRLLRV